MKTINRGSGSWFGDGSGNGGGWSEAYERLELYLQTHGIINKLQQAHFILPILEKTRQVHAANPSISPMIHAIEMSREAMASWFKSVLLDANQLPASTHAMLLQGETALFLCDAQKKWPELIFQPDAANHSDFMRALRSALPQAGPELAFSSMAARRISLGAWSHAAGHAFEMLERKKLVKLTIIWSIVTLLLILIFWITR